MARRDIRTLLDQLAAREEDIFRREFLAPCVGRGVVHIRFDGVVCSFRVRGGFEGWGVFRPTGPGDAEFTRAATLSERRRYLDLLPRRSLILCERVHRHWLAGPAHDGDRRFAPGPVPTFHVEEAQPFDTVEARHDGARCWFDALDERADPAAAVYLRDSLRDRVPVESLTRPGLTSGQRGAYAVAWRMRELAERDRVEDRLRDALAHGGANLVGYAERGDGYRVEFTVDGSRHVSVVNKKDFTLQVAGVCLSGEDGHFDLASLAGVLREGAGALRIGTDNDGMQEAVYWDVHPPPPS